MAGGGTFRASRGKGSRGAKSRSLQTRTSPTPSSGTTPQLVSQKTIESVEVVESSARAAKRVTTPQLVSRTPHEPATIVEVAESSARAANRGTTPQLVSRTPHEPAIIVEVAESSARDANTDQDSPQQQRGPRGAYLNKNIPTDASERKVIHIYGLNYLEQEVPRMISKDFKGNFYGKQTEWNKLDKNLVEHLYKCFQDRYMYDEPVDPKLAKHVWTKRSQRLCSGTWNAIRAKCKKESGSVIPTDWSEYCPDNIDQEDWEDILKSWMKLEWQKRSKVGSENRKKVPGDESGTSSYVRHTAGSTNFGIHRKTMRDETGIDPTEIELFERVHKLNKGKGEWCDARAKSVHSKYHDTVKERNPSEVEITAEGDATDANPPLPAPTTFDAQAWVIATGKPQKNIYGFGLTKEAENIHRQVKPSSTRQFTFHASTSANNESNNESEISELKKENASRESEIIALKKENDSLKANVEQIMKALNMQQVNMPSNE